MKRRDFVKQSMLFAAGAALTGSSCSVKTEPIFKISLAEWSLHLGLFAGDYKHLDFAKIAKQEFGITAVEYVNQFFMDKANDTAYLQEMKNRAEENGVTNVLIMCDNEGKLGDPDETARIKAVENHYKWVDAALFLGCHSIRVNAASEGSWEEQAKLAADGLAHLIEFAVPRKINVIVENHGGLSSNAEWLTTVMKIVNDPGCGTLPDFGNFRVSESETYDKYKGVAELMPYAKGVSAKTGNFDAQGNAVDTDYLKMMKIVLAAGYHGYVGIEYSGGTLAEYDGIRATQALLEKIKKQLS